MSHFPHIETTRSWRLVCLVAFFPFLTIWHHAVFHHSQCILNPQRALDYSFESISHLLTTNPAIYAAGTMCLMCYYLGNRLSRYRYLLVFFCIAFAPLTIWIVDIPFTGRFICRTLHDDRFMLFADTPLRSRYFYLLGATLFTGLLFPFRGRRFLKSKDTSLSQPTD